MESHLNIVNSTISGNQCNAVGSGSGVENYDGGSLLTIRHSTITNNSCSGGGIFNNTAPPVLSHTIVAGNSTDRPDLSGSFSGDGYNLIGNRAGSSGFSDGVNNDLVGKGYGRNCRCDIGAFEFEGNPTAVTLTTLVSSPTTNRVLFPFILLLLVLSGLGLIRHLG
jgi:large repetitive protein